MKAFELEYMAGANAGQRENRERKAGKRNAMGGAALLEGGGERQYKVGVGR
jgi:hypothetical protein